MLDELGEACVARYGWTVRAHHLGSCDAGDRMIDRRPPPFHLSGVDQEPSEKAQPYAVEQMVQPKSDEDAADDHQVAYCAAITNHVKWTAMVTPKI
jgi:hypothetical protein